eukprot:gene864-1356_t
MLFFMPGLQREGHTRLGSNLVRTYAQVLSSDPVADLQALSHDAVVHYAFETTQAFTAAHENSGVPSCSVQTTGVFEDADENDKNNEDEDDEDGEDDEDDEDDVEPAKGEDNDQYVDEDDDENTKADEDENTSSSDLDNPMLEGGKRLLNHRYERDQDRRKSREQSRKSKKESFHEENGVVGPLHKLAELAEQAPMLILSSGQEFQTRGLLELRVAEFCERVGKEYKTHCSARCGLAGDAKVRFRKDSERSSEPVVPLMCHKFRRE